MVTRLPMLLTILVTWLAPAVPAMAQDTATVDLRPIWREGQTSRYQVSSRRVTTVEVRGMDASRSSMMDVEGEVTWEVLTADAKGGGTARMTITDMTMTAGNDSGESFTVTTTKAPEHLQSIKLMLGAIVGAPLTVEVNADGSIGAVTGWKQIKTDAGDAGKHLTERDFQESAADLATLVGGVAEATTGSTWKHTFEWEHEMGQLQVNATYKLQGVETTADIPMAMIQQDADIDCTVDQSKLPAGQAQVSLKLAQGKQTSQLMFDLTRNECVGANTDRLLVFEMNISNQGRSITQVITQRMNSQSLRIAEE